MDSAGIVDHTLSAAGTKFLDKNDIFNTPSAGITNSAVWS